jgi:hypothetical protein
MAHLHIVKIRVAWLGEGARVLRDWLALILALSITATAASAAHVRLKGPSLFFVRHCVVWVGAGATRPVEEDRESLRSWGPRGRPRKRE